jgi:hypothetical protein
MLKQLRSRWIARSAGLMLTMAFALVVNTSIASARNYDIEVGLLCCQFVTSVTDKADPVGTGYSDFQISAPYADRRIKWNRGNPHSTRVSYNLLVDFSVYEVTDIPLNNHVAHYFTQAHPGIFRGGGDWVVVRARNLGPNPIHSHGQVYL